MDSLSNNPIRKIHETSKSKSGDRMLFCSSVFSIWWKSLLCLIWVLNLGWPIQDLHCKLWYDFFFAPGHYCHLSKRDINASYNQGSLSFCHWTADLDVWQEQVLQVMGWLVLNGNLCLMQVNEVDRLMEIIRNAAQEGSIVFYTLADPIMAEAAKEACEVRLSSHCSLNFCGVIFCISYGMFQVEAD